MSRTPGRVAPSPELQELARTLGVEVAALDFLDGVPGADLERLEQDLASVLAADDVRVEAGLRGAVAALPRPLRGRGAKLIGAEE